MYPYLYLICRDVHGILLAGKKIVCLKGTLISHFGYKERQKLLFKKPTECVHTAHDTFASPSICEV